ncbi:MAG: hypothetical protein LQ342_008354 [Letrouitia transgressa]|nr:MAG: hypothetical protein LQ342_008354 [Letrouitia transgressa]
MLPLSSYINDLNQTASPPLKLTVTNFTGPPRSPILTDINATSATVIHSNPHVGTLPLAVFINVIIGIVIGSLLVPSVISLLLRLSIQPWTEPETAGPFSNPPFNNTRPTVSSMISDMAQDEFKRRAQSTSRLSTPRNLSTLSRNLPLPASTQQIIESPPADDTSFDEIYKLESLVKEKLQLDVEIRNWERLDRARPHRDISSDLGVSDHTREALNRLSGLKTALGQALVRFKNNRNEWTAEEWRAIEKIDSLLEKSWS